VTPLFLRGVKSKYYFHYLKTRKEERNRKK
jgi:hypothetical protein